MALRHRTALTNNSNQENVKNIKSTINVVPGQTRRAALGEIGNRVATLHGLDPINKNGQLVKKKPVSKQLIAVKEHHATTKPVNKLPVQQVKCVLKKDNIEVHPPIEVKQIECKQEVILDVPKSNIDAFSSDLLQIEDIDEADKTNPILVTIYSNDIYTYLRKLEARYPIQKGYLIGQEVNAKMRSVLIDWLVEVHQQFHLLQETLYLTVAIIDRFLQAVKTTTKKRLQLVGVTAMFIASKYEEMYAPDISDFVYITDNAYDKHQILQMEMLMTRTLDYSFGRPLSLHFLRRYSKIGRALPMHHTMAKYFLEQCLVHYEMCHYPPSLIAAAAMYLAFFIIGDEDNEGKIIWTNTLAHYSTYTKSDVLPIAREIAKLIVNAENSKYQAVRKKYVHSKHMKISLRPELKSPIMLEMAKLD
ncbi:hypothetical protein PV327_002471 [Microctonus hyperodae]|uniref:G2/mitotic-specific cyclin-B n=1 Tax=Microctonus hyperodae TaxID=165561 RepID=A0AA39FFS1_MICHY|nr:hypothetical protein PV327_002471 [Microctonus hyperodae]